jgi:hypothetical protein
VPELLMVLRQDFMEDVPGEAETISRTAASSWVFDHLFFTLAPKTAAREAQSQLSSSNERYRICR